MERIPVAGPWIADKEVAYVADAARNAWYAGANRYHERFEQAFARYIGVPFAIALPSCTSAIHLALLGLGVGPGDEVILPDCTWIASAAPVTYVGATPVFADIEADTWCLSARSFEARITPRTRAVIPVNLYGGMPDLDAIDAVARPRGIAVVEDAAEAIGSELGGRRAGSLGDAGVFSFHGSKTLTTGEGGMLVTRREDLWRRALFLRDHARAPGGKMFWNTEVGYKYKMSAMQAALGLAQLERIDELVARKRQIFAWYRDALAGAEGVTLNAEPPGTLNTYWMVTAIVHEVDKERLIQSMSEQAIDCRPFFYPLSSMPAYQGLVHPFNPISYGVSPHGINLPSGFNLDEAAVARVADALRRSIADSRR